jgi:hypothetical protein
MLRAVELGESPMELPWQTGQRIFRATSSVRLSSLSPESGAEAGAPTMPETKETETFLAQVGSLSVQAVGSAA